MYLQGKGVDRDLKTAFRLFSDTAKAGNSWGQNNLGAMYEMGWGTVKNTDTALALYEKSASAGNNHGSSNLIRLRAVMDVKENVDTVKQELDATQSSAAGAESALEEQTDNSEQTSSSTD